MRFSNCVWFSVTLEKWVLVMRHCVPRNRWKKKIGLSAIWKYNVTLYFFRSVIHARDQFRIIFPSSGEFQGAGRSFEAQSKVSKHRYSLNYKLLKICKLLGLEDQRWERTTKSFIRCWDTSLHKIFAGMSRDLDGSVVEESARNCSGARMRTAGVNEPTIA